MRWKLLDEGGMHLCTAAQLQPRVTSEPIPKRLQKGPKTEGERERTQAGMGWGRICSFAKKRATASTVANVCCHEGAFLPAQQLYNG